MPQSWILVHACHCVVLGTGIGNWLLFCENGLYLLNKPRFGQEIGELVEQLVDFDISLPEQLGQLVRTRVDLLHVHRWCE